ncbi:MAG: hypothetical protein JKX76_15360 [Colwellia sp.]|nr:hypothetical protein [Colwellia sp.]
MTLKKSRKMDIDKEAEATYLANRNIENSDNDRKGLLFCDFLDKLSWLSDERGNELQNLVLSSKLVDNDRLIWEKRPVDRIVKRNFDILIITVKNTELQAAMAAFGIQIEQSENFRINSFRFYTGVLETNQGVVLSFAITMLGKDTNLRSLNLCNELLAEVNVKNAYMLGMAGGPREKVNLGDVIISTAVCYHQPGKVTENGTSKRPLYIEAEDRNIPYYRLRKARFKESWSYAFDHKDTGEPLPEGVTLDWTPRVETGVIMCGENLIAFSEATSEILDLHGDTKAIEMEGFGFAQACKNNSVNWIVFRGISDFADEKSRGSDQELCADRDIWQYSATLAAASVLRDYLICNHRLEESKEF